MCADISCTKKRAQLVQFSTACLYLNILHLPFSVVSRWNTTSAQSPLLDFLTPWPQLEYLARPGDDQLDLVPSGGRDEGHGEAAVELCRPRLVYLSVKSGDTVM